MAVTDRAASFMNMIIAAVYRDPVGDIVSVAGRRKATVKAVRETQQAESSTNSKASGLYKRFR